MCDDDDTPWKVVVLTLAIVAACAAVACAWHLLSSNAWAEGPASKWGHDPATSEWFRSLRSPRGFSCCDYADGTRIEAPDYHENNDGSYDVQARGQTVHIPPEKIVQGTNRVGYAILWWGAGPEPYCFLPGARG